MQYVFYHGIIIRFDAGPPGKTDNNELMMKNNNFPVMTVAVAPIDQIFVFQMVMELRIAVENDVVKEESAELNSQWRVSECLILKYPINNKSISLNIIKESAIFTNQITEFNIEMEKIISQNNVNRCKMMNIKIESRLKPVSGGELITLT